MAIQCFICKKQIGFLQGLSSFKHEGETVCNECQLKAEKICNLYNADFRDHSMKELCVIASKYDEFVQIIAKLETLEQFYHNNISKVKHEISYLENEIAEWEKDIFT